MPRIGLGRKRVALIGCVVAVLSGTAATYALTRNDERLCTLIYSSSGVSLFFRTEDVSHVKRARLCVDARCVRMRAGEHAWAGGLAVRNPGPRTVSVVLVLESSGGPAEVRSARVPLRRFEINGPGCGTDWRADTRYVDGRIVAGKPTGGLMLDVP